MANELDWSSFYTWTEGVVVKETAVALIRIAFRS